MNAKTSARLWKIYSLLKKTNTVINCIAVCLHTTDEINKDFLFGGEYLESSVFCMQDTFARATHST